MNLIPAASSLAITARSSSASRCRRVSFRLIGGFWHAAAIPAALRRSYARCRSRTQTRAEWCWRRLLAPVAACFRSATLDHRLGDLGAGCQAQVLRPDGGKIAAGMHDRHRVELPRKRGARLRGVAARTRILARFTAEMYRSRCRLARRSTASIQRI